MQQHFYVSVSIDLYPSYNRILIYNMQNVNIQATSAPSGNKEDTGVVPGIRLLKKDQDAMVYPMKEIGLHSTSWVPSDLRIVQSWGWSINQKKGC